LHRHKQRIDLQKHYRQHYACICTYFDDDIAALNEGRALAELAHAHELTRGAALNNVGHLLMSQLLNSKTAAPLHALASRRSIR
jgi:hypothetical protein